MKKILLPMLAVILAVGFSAFTSVKPHKVHRNHYQPSLYWYNVNGSQIGSLKDPNTFMKDDAIGNITECQDDDGLCHVGATANNLQGQSIAGNIPDDPEYRILQTGSK